MLSHQKGNQDAHLILCVWPQTEKLSGPSPNLSALRASPDINLKFLNLPKVESNVSKNQFHASLVLVLTLMGIFEPYLPPVTSEHWSELDPES